jgi:hypothetical protein
VKVLGQLVLRARARIVGDAGALGGDGRLARGLASAAVSGVTFDCGQRGGERTGRRQGILRVEGDGGLGDLVDLVLRAAVLSGTWR